MSSAHTHKGTEPKPFAALRSALWGLLRGLGWAGPVLALLPGGYLHRTGWMRSVSSRRSLDAQGQPQPWYSYPFLAFFVPRVQASWRVFEFGAGDSTRWYAARVAQVHAVEHDPEWAERLRPTLPPNVRLTVEPAVTYTRPLAEATEPYDVIIIDGIERPACCTIAPLHLTEAGVIIVDNSERPEYAPSLEALSHQGFRRLDFEGLVAVSNLSSCTSVFYRPGNVLGL